MSADSRMNRALANAKLVPITKDSKFVLFSDCHRGDGSLADNLAKNQNLYYAALRYYQSEGFTYIELGDGDELWENKKMMSIKREYPHILALLSELYRENRLLMLYGNHDRVKKSARWCAHNLCTYLDDRTQTQHPLFMRIKVHESVLLMSPDNPDHRLLLLHGHQADFFNDTLWRLSRFLVRYLWRPLELVGIHDPFSAADPDHHKAVELKLTAWAQAHKQPLVAGHTHRTAFPRQGDTPYYNDGSCTHPRCITGLEIVGEKITLIKWHTDIRADGVLFVNRAELQGPASLWS